MNSTSCLRERQSLRHAFTPVTKPEGSRERIGEARLNITMRLVAFPTQHLLNNRGFSSTRLRQVTVRRMSGKVASGSPSVHSNPFRERIAGMDNERSGLCLSGSGRSQITLPTQRPLYSVSCLQNVDVRSPISDMTAHQVGVAKYSTPTGFGAGFGAG
jgi:hypothetical protein